MLEEKIYKLEKQNLSVMGKIVAIGGGEIGRPGYPITTLTIDKKILQLTGKKKPNLLFIPTASSDSEGYVEVVKKYFGKKLGCKVDVLYLIRESPSKKEISDKIKSADVIYVGGGNTLKMMRKWRQKGVDSLVRKAYQKGTVLSGLSAGAICWFKYGHSDSMSFYNPNKWEYIRVKGMGLINATICPHYNGETKGKPRAYWFKQMIAKKGGIGIGLDDNSALAMVNGKYRILTSQKNAHAYLVYRRKGRVVEKEIKKNKMEGIVGL